MMDSIFIEQLAVRTIIGVLPHERERAQRLLLDLELFTDMAPAAMSEDLSKALNYAEIAEYLEQFAQHSRFELLETFAEALCRELLARYALCVGVKLKITKPQAIAQSALVGVKITRMRYNQTP